jgi:hypothetical protein
MANIAALETLVDNYVQCWAPTRAQLQGALIENNDFGCEGLQVFRNAVKLEDFAHAEMTRLVVLLTRSLRGQINSDHYFLWSWAAHLTVRFGQHGMLGSSDWQPTFEAYVNLLLSTAKLTPGPQSQVEQSEVLKHANYHALNAISTKHLAAGPLGFALLEGTLRRKCSNYVATDGEILKEFHLPSRKDPHKVGKSLNRINQALELLEMKVATDRGRPVEELANFYAEVEKLYPSPPTVPDHIDSWRNDLLHGNTYWQVRNPIIANLLCLLVLDEIPAGDYDAYRSTKMAEDLTFMARTRETSGTHTIFPPHLLR